MRVAWSTDIMPGLGDNLGYSYHSQKVKQLCEAQGVVWDPGQRVVLHWLPPHVFEPIEGRFNVLYTMFETWPQPPDCLEAMRRADLVLVPCRWCALRLADVGVEARLVPLGVDHKKLPYLDHFHRPGELFHFVYVGAPNPRKGWDLVMLAFASAFAPADPVCLTFKITTQGRAFYSEAVLDRVFVDARPYTSQALAQLYQQAHACVLPSRGEGFGATAAEAMASGALVLAPAHTGLADFVGSETALVLPTAMQPAQYGVPVMVPAPTVTGLASAMRAAYENYDATLAIRRAGAELIHGQFTLEQTAQRLIQVLGGLS